MRFFSKVTIIYAAFCLVAGLTLISCVKRPGKTIDQLNPAELELLRWHCLQVLAANSYVFGPYENYHLVGPAYFVTNANLRQELSGWAVRLEPDYTNRPQHMSLWAMGVDASEHIVVGDREFTAPTNGGWRMITNGIYKFGGK
jgi:hypothetical protein